MLTVFFFVVCAVTLEAKGGKLNIRFQDRPNNSCNPSLLKGGLILRIPLLKDGKQLVSPAVVDSAKQAVEAKKWSSIKG